jgi:hypothetical protein
MRGAACAATCECPVPSHHDVVLAEAEDCESATIGVMRAGRIASILFAIALGSAASAAAQGAYEIQVYPSELVPARHTMFELHSNFTPLGQRNPPDGTQPTDNALHETLEITHGFNEWFEVGGYVFTSVRAGDGWRYVGSHIRPRFTIPARWKWPVGVSLSQEIGFEQRYFSPEKWTWEIRPIIDQTLGRLYWSLNLAFERALSGSGPKSFDFAPAAKVSYDVTAKVAAGVEYYGDLGGLTHFNPLSQEQHQIYPTIDLTLSPKFEFNAGVGVGLTSAGDKLVLKVIVGYRVGGR